MSTQDDGGSAFPADATTNLFSRGMSLRDYFAAKAMQAVIAMDGAMVDGKSLSIPTNADGVAAAAWAMADAMLIARSAPGEN